MCECCNKNDLINLCAKNIILKNKCEELKEAKIKADEENVRLKKNNEIYLNRIQKLSHDLFEILYEIEKVKQTKKTDVSVDSKKKNFDCDLLSAKEEVMLFFMSILSLIGLSVVVATIIKIILRW